MNVVSLLTLRPPSRDHVKIVSEIILSSHEVVKEVVEFSLSKFVELEAESVEVKRSYRVLWVACWNNYETVD